MKRIAKSDENLRVIHSCPLFAALTVLNVQLLASSALRKSYQAGEQIFRQDDECPGIFVVERGLIRIYRDAENGQRHVLHLCGPGQSFAEVAVFAGFPLPASASCVEAARCILIPSDAIQNHLKLNHAFCREMLAGMAYWTRHFTERMTDIVLRDATDRVAKYLASLPRSHDGLVELPGFKKDIASQLNLTGETFSRTLRRLAEAGEIAFVQPRQIRIINCP